MSRRRKGQMQENIRVSTQTIEALAEILTGGSATASPDSPRYGPYRSGPKLVGFFNQYGVHDSYPDSVGSRVEYARERLSSFNGTPAMASLIEDVVDPRGFIGNPNVTIETAVEHLNTFLHYEGLEVVKARDFYRLRRRGGTAVHSSALSFALPEDRREYIDEHLRTCEDRLVAGDYPGVITRARALVEEVLLQIEGLVDSAPPPHDGDLPKLYKRVYRGLNLDPGEKGLNDAVRQVLSGLISVIAGLAPLRNAVGDAHAFGYRPYRHHAELAVNSAKTIVSFLSGTLSYQVEKGFLALIDAVANSSL